MEQDYPTNYLIRLNAEGLDPVKSGDMKSWFYFYKWRPGEDDEVFFPIHEDSFPHIAAGDAVWFTMCGKGWSKWLGCVKLLRVLQDDNNDKKELWYNCKDIDEGRDASVGVLFVDTLEVP